MHQFIKFSTSSVFALLLMCCVWATAQGQSVGNHLDSFSSRAGFSRQQVKQQVKQEAKQVKHQIRVDSSLGKSEQKSFILQEDDGTSGGELSDQDDEPTKTDDSLSPSSLDHKEDDLELDDDLDMDDELDRRPARPAFGPWPKKGIRGIKVDVRETSSNAPEDVSQQLIASNRSVWTQFAPQRKVFAWVAPEIKYQPLYFEDVALERYGTTAGPYHQSLISGFHFFKDFVFLPHKMRHDAPSSCDHPLGFCRPGNSTPYSLQRHYFGRPGQ